MALPGLSAYVTAKHALEGMSQALAAEVATFGIRVSVLEPVGADATGYAGASTERAVRIPAYDAVTGMVLDGIRSMGETPGLGSPSSSPTRAAGGRSRGEDSSAHARRGRRLRVP